MTAETMWRRFCADHRVDPDTPHTAWAFGGAPDKLAALVLDGKKTATASAYDLYFDQKEPLPKAGDYSVILSSAGEAVCVIRTTVVYATNFSLVDADHAAQEGEGDLSLDYWREVHREFFTGELAAVGRTFSETMPVLCERFEVVYRPAAPVLTTARLRLREYTQADYDDLKAIIGDPVTMKYYEKPYDDRGVQRWLDWSRDNYAAFGFGLWAIEDADGAFVGDCGITMQNINHKILPEIGYHIRRDCWGREYAPEAARACRDWIFTHTPFREVYSYMNAANRQSRRVAEKNGMTLRGEYDEGGVPHTVYSITREEWERLLREDAAGEA